MGRARVCMQPKKRSSKSKEKGSIFFEKKKQKTFVTWNTPTKAGALQVTKFFCFFLFTKRRLLPCNLAPRNEEPLMELRHLRYFLAIADQMSFTAAAELVHVTQSTLSHQIRQLEEELGTTLFERSARGAHLTRAGEIFLAGVRRAMRDIDGTIAMVKNNPNGPAGEVRFLIGSHGFALSLLPGCLHNFIEKCPAVRTSVSEFISVAFHDKLETESFDIAIGENWAADTPPANTSFVFEPLYTEELALAVSRDHPLARRKRVRIVELHQCKLALPTPDIAARRVMDRCFAQAGVVPNIVIELSALDCLYQIVRQSDDVATVLANNVFSNEGVVFVPMEDPTPMRAVGFFWRKGAESPAEVRVFANLIRHAVVSASFDRASWPRIRPCSQVRDVDASLRVTN